ncbi:GAF domain-containing protein [Streptomyces clavuligerus]|uniref:Regulatory protein n=1 Tax=Streptomyces clavuligerus TaxID=1901 RepID=E2PVY5_STRCL|nr:GAF domain-containing protein [Streptomyces clavuligerus]ANW17524.1 diguanylate cyclase [Streptomyces clavuligerus]AXU12069.1 GAF domain-containing protein [Streptomyces clavuligerus]EFG09975.1 Regulatory protein [Streptomyces clavuligerus]MBY6301930.1 GAF domain-containing protein [Streptomyces clavuligerus]QCS04850.1 diguanylate cyclase [Streptomyces clavuligerus]
MPTTPLDPPDAVPLDPAETDRLLTRVGAQPPGDGRPAAGPRAEIAESWRRLLRHGLDPGREPRAGLLSRDELERRRQDSPLGEVLDVLRAGLVSASDAARLIMVVADAEGRMLWREGEATVRRKADAHGFVPGADLNEEWIGTNGVGTALITGRPIHVHATEHFLAAHRTWTCAGAPVVDPRDGRPLGVVNVSGPLATVHPTMLALVTSVARLAEAELRRHHFAALERLRSSAAPLLGRMGGRALAVDGDGWTAAVIGMPPPDRLALPKPPPDGRVWLPALGMCAMEPLPGGWLLRPEEAADPGGCAPRVLLDLSRAHRPSVTVRGEEGSWTYEPSPRHAELLCALARHPGGRSAAELAADLFADPSRTVTVRAEFSRLRRHLAPVLASRPYRFADGVEVEVIPPAPGAFPGAPTAAGPGVCPGAVETGSEAAGGCRGVRAAVETGPEVPPAPARLGGEQPGVLP